LTFDVSVLEGSLSGGSGPAALFIDPGLFNYWHAPVYHGAWYRGAPVAAGVAVGAAVGAAAAYRYDDPYPRCGYYPYPPCY